MGLDKRPRKISNTTIDPSKLDRLKGYLKTAWIDDQLGFYKKNSLEHEKKYKMYELFGFGLFLVAFIVACLHASELRNLIQDSVATPILVSLGIILPTLGASLSGLLSNHEFHRIAARYEQMVYPLENIKQQIDTPITPEQFFIIFYVS